MKINFEIFSKPYFPVLLLIILIMISKEISLIFNEELVIASTMVVLLLILTKNLRNIIYLELLERNNKIKEQLIKNLNNRKLLIESRLNIIELSKIYHNLYTYSSTKLVRALENLEKAKEFAFLNNFENFIFFQYYYGKKLTLKSYLNLYFKLKKLELRVSILDLSSIQHLLNEENE